MNLNIKNKITKYYNDKIIESGANHNGVDWNSKESQYLRFNKLLYLIESNKSKFTLLDFGCGYGELINLIDTKQIYYIGYDVADEMLKKAKKTFPIKNITFTNVLPNKVDYIVASGVFNVKNDICLADWENYFYETLNLFDQISSSGFSFNVLTSYSDESYKKDYLYYPSPEEVFSYCKSKFSRNISLHHDYDLYEFTITVKK